MTAGFLTKTYAACLATFLLLDFAWLAWIARGFYRRQLGDLLSSDVRWGAAIIFYLIFVAGIVAFAVLPSIERGSLPRAVLMGGFFGLVAYAAYDLTNLATLKGFPTIVAVVDMVWGFTLTAAVTCVGYLVASAGRAG